MANIQFNGNQLHYLILDCGDGSARVQFFENLDALELYLEKMERNGEYGDLSEGGSFVDQADVDNAMTQAEVEKEYS